LQIIELKLTNVISVFTLSLLEWESTDIASDRDKIIVYPDPNKIFTKRKARICSTSLANSPTQIKGVSKVSYPTTGWGKALENLPLFTKAEMKKHIEELREFWQEDGGCGAPFCAHRLKRCKNLSPRGIFEGY